MKASEYAKFCEGGAFGDGDVMVQFRVPLHLAIAGDRGTEMVVINPREHAIASAEDELGRGLNEQELAALQQLPDEPQNLPPTPVVVGRLAALSEHLLLLSYKSGARQTVNVALRPEEIVAVSAAHRSRLVT